MYVLQRAKASLPILRKAKMTRLSLLFASLLLCFTVLSLFGGAGTAQAASLGSRSANVPATTGGGCTNDPNGKLRPCLSEDSTRSIVPDGYITANNVCNVVIDLYAEGYGDGQPLTYIAFGSRCFNAGTHLFGAKYPDASAYHTWYTVMFYSTPLNNLASPPLYT